MKKLLIGLAVLLALELLILVAFRSCATPEPTAPSAQATNGTSTPTTQPTLPPETEPTAPPDTEPTLPALHPVTQYADMKAMWLSQYDLSPIYLSGNKQRSEADFTARMETVLDNVVLQGYNTIFLQVRPFADSMYPSEYFPMSPYVVGAVGNEAKYDPVEIIVRLARARQLSIHAWINPLRGVKEKEIQQVGTQYPIRQWYDDPQKRGRYLVLEGSRWYLNPAYPEVRALICNGAREVLERYQLDGLHMDDYFYPTTIDASFDTDAYADYQAAGGTLSVENFRRDSLNKLIAALYAVTKSFGDDLLFGISPEGNWNNVYNAQLADIYTWCAQPGYIDYICPQVYFGLEHGSYDFIKVCRKYQDMIKTDSVKLIVGMTLGKAYSQEDKWAGSGKTEWADHKDVLARCLQTTLDLEKCSGIAMFCYQYYYIPATGEEVVETAEERANFLPVFLEISWQ